MSIHKMKWVMDTSVDPKLKLTLLVMADATPDEGTCYLSNTELSRRTGHTTRSIQRHKKLLVAQGLIVDTGMRDPHTGQIPMYHLPCGEYEPGKHGVTTNKNPRKGTGDNLSGVTPVTQRGDMGVTQTQRTQSVYINKKTPQPEKTEWIDESRSYWASVGGFSDEYESWYDHFQSNGWKVGGKTKMRDWKAAVRNGVKTAKKMRGSNGKGQKSNGYDLSQAKPGESMEAFTARMERDQANSKRGKEWAI